MTDKELQEGLDKIKIKKNALMLLGFIFFSGITAFTWAESWSNNDDVTSIGICFISIIFILGAVLELDAYLTKKKLIKEYELNKGE